MSEKKSIYDLNMKEMRTALIKFSSTLYGRTIFFLLYFLPFITFLVALGLLIAYFFVPINLFWAVIGTLIAFIVLFVVANILYYKELRIFIEKH